jgi:hypothetical protein
MYKVISFQGHKIMYPTTLSIVRSEMKDCGQVLDMAYELQLKAMMKWQYKCTIKMHCCTTPKLDKIANCTILPSMKT